jgi:hypothetical protein
MRLGALRGIGPVNGAEDSDEQRQDDAAKHTHGPGESDQDSATPARWIEEDWFAGHGDRARNKDVA